MPEGQKENLPWKTSRPQGWGKGLEKWTADKWRIAAGAPENINRSIGRWQ